MTLARSHGDALAEMLVELRELHGAWAQRLFSEPQVLVDVAASLSGDPHAAALTLMLDTLDELPAAGVASREQLRWAVAESWLEGLGQASVEQLVGDALERMLGSDPSSPDRARLCRELIGAARGAHRPDAAGARAALAGALLSSAAVGVADPSGPAAPDQSRTHVAASSPSAASMSAASMSAAPLSAASLSAAPLSAAPLSAAPPGEAGSEPATRDLATPAASGRAPESSTTSNQPGREPMLPDLATPATSSGAAPESTTASDPPSRGPALADLPTSTPGTAPEANPPRRQSDLEQLTRALTGRATALLDDPLRLAATFDRLTKREPARLRGAVETLARQPAARARWAQTLPESALVRLVDLLAPHRGTRLLESAELLAVAWSRTTAGRSAPLSRSELWTFVLNFVGERPAAQRSLDALLHRFFTARCPHDPSPSDGPRHTREQLWTLARDRALALGRGELRAALHRRRRELLRPQTASPRPRETSTRANEATAGSRETRSRPTQRRPSNSKSSSSSNADAAFALGERDPSERPHPDALYIDNAGLIVFGPYLPFWLRSLGLYPEGGDAERLALDPLRDRSRAVHLLQWLVDGRCDAPEPSLALNKLLLGLPLDAVIEAEHQPSDSEIQLCERLLATVLSHWTALGGTSNAGLRETFLQREARLEPSPQGWRLRVQRKTLDVLVDQIPWTTSLIKQPWMPEPLYVTW